MVMWNLEQDFFRPLKPDSRTIVFHEGFQRAGECRSERSLMISCQDDSEVGLTSVGDS
jgi:hypothetical protein